MSWQTIETAAKRLELAKELIPGVKRIAVLFQAADLGAALDVKAVLGAAAGSNLGYVLAQAGMLLTYGLDPLKAFERSAFFVDKILKGAKPAELPIEQPTVFELTINLKTAKALGLAVPESIVFRATKVIR